MVTVKGACHWITAMCLLPGTPPERQRDQIMFYEGFSHLAKKSTGSETFGRDYKLALACAKVVDKEPVYLSSNMKEDMKLRSM